jgi:hydroxylamine reductase
VEPRESYRDRIFTTNAVGFDGVKHLTNQQYGPLVEKAKECEGFTDDEPETYTMTGFGHDAVLGIAGDVSTLRYWPDAL